MPFGQQATTDRSSLPLAANAGNRFSNASDIATNCTKSAAPIAPPTAEQSPKITHLSTENPKSSICRTARSPFVQSDFTVADRKPPVAANARN
jgi:hypothetical protein